MIIKQLKLININVLALFLNTTIKSRHIKTKKIKNTEQTNSKASKIS